nr:nucleotidyltransferase family protein [uncultured Sphingomonas sp.]
MEPMLTLVADCCRPALSDADLALLGPRLAKADGTRLALLARRHRVEGLVWRTMSRAGIVPLGAQPIGEAARRIAADGLVMALESGRVHQAFSRASLPHLFVKGLTLGVLAWSDPLVKQQLDIDLLVPPTAIAKAARLLEALGYVQQIPEPSVDPADWHRSRKESQWRSDDGILLDLHSRLGDHPALLPTATANLSPRMVEVPGSHVLPTLPERLLLPYLAVHGASSAWFRLKWLADFAALVARTPPAVLTTLAEQAPRLGAGRSMAASLILANRLLGTAIPETVEADRPTHRLVELALTALSDAREPTARRFGTIPMHRSQLLLIPGSHYFLSEFVRKAGLLIIR